MALLSQNCEKLIGEWTTAFPRVGKSKESPYFNLEHYDWNFKLTSEWSDSAYKEIGTMKFKKRTRREMPESFLLTVHVRGKTRDLFVAHKKITDFETEIWSCNLDAFYARYPMVAVVGGTMTFIFSFDYGVRDTPFWNMNRGHKSVQTSDEIPPSSYLDDRLCLENLSLNFRKLMVEDSDTDVQLKCGDCTLHAHKLILSARSQVFRTMLQSDMREGREGSVEIDDMEPSVFEIFIRYLYSGTLPELSEDIVMPLYEAGDKYDVLALKMRCGDFLAENLSRESCCRIIATADAHSDNSLKNRVISYMLDEKVPNNDEEWSKFCNDHPKLANEVLNQAYKQANSSR